VELIGIVDPKKSGKNVWYEYETVTLTASPGCEAVFDEKLHDPDVLMATHAVETVMLAAEIPVAAFLAAPLATDGMVVGSDAVTDARAPSREALITPIRE